MGDFLAGLFAAVLTLFSPAAVPAGYSGYLEADTLYVAALGAGRVSDLRVEEGQPVLAGDSLFALDVVQQQTLLAAATARREAAEASLEDLATGSRDAELDVIRAALAKAEADLQLAEASVARSERLRQSGAVPAARLDEDRNARAAAEAQVAQLRAQLAVAELPGRAAQRRVAEANLRAARADEQRARLDLAERYVAAPASGRVKAIYFRNGEVVGPGDPVLALLPAGTLEARFFVPETVRATLALGQEVTVTCDSCVGLTAHITRIGSEPQTTPPVIYSREERSRLVYLVRARLDAPGTMQPGQPVTVLP